MLAGPRNAEAGAPIFAHNHVPLTVLPFPPNTPRAGRQQHDAFLRTLEPDILLITQQMNADDRIAHIEELKVCRHPRPTEQLSNALNQHLALVKALQQACIRNVKIIPILIKVSGTMYQKIGGLGTIYQKIGGSGTIYQKLGLSRAGLPKTAAKLHVQAIKSMCNIVQTTRVLEYSECRTNPVHPKAPDKPPCKIGEAHTTPSVVVLQRPSAALGTASQPKPHAPEGRGLASFLPSISRNEAGYNQGNASFDLHLLLHTGTAMSARTRRQTASSQTCPCLATPTSSTCLPGTTSSLKIHQSRSVAILQCREVCSGAHGSGR